MTETALRTAKAVVVLWSPRSVASRWVRAEATEADRNGTLVPATIEACKRPIMFELTQTAELSHWQGDATDPAWQAFLAGVRRFVGKPAQAQSAPPAEAAPLPLPSKPSIAVMPFANLSSDPDQEYFADGMVVEIVEALSRFRSIFVIASGSSLSFKGKSAGAQDAARQLGVRYILEGNVRRAGSRVRIGVQLIDAAEGRPIWTHRFEDTLEDIFGLQEKVALAIAGKIEPTIQQAEIQGAIARPTENMGSYDLYLRALAAGSNFSKAGVLTALDLARRAVELDPEYAPALALVVTCHHYIVAFSWSDDPEDNRRQGAEALQRALKAGKDDPAVLARAAMAMRRLTGDYRAAQALAARATDLNPGSSIAWMALGTLRSQNGETDLAVEALETALRLDPMGSARPLQIGALGAARVLQGRFAEAVELLREANQLLDIAGFPLFLAAALGYLGETVAAVEALARYRTLASTPVDDFLRSNYQPAEAALILEGLALAQGKSPAATEARAE